ncbi:MAG: hypothetical protein JWQ01_2570 [Massilia sp.]|nr:hypothetical protein [Massilia sp.]
MLTSQSIRDVFAAHSITHDYESFYFLVDHAGMPGLHRKLIHAKMEWASLFKGTSQVNALSVAPLLIRVGTNSQIPHHNDFLTWICERGPYSSSLTLLASPLAIHELVSRLTARLDARISDDMDVLLRFYDPRVFEQLVQSLSGEQRRVFLSAASSWWFVDRSGELRAVEATFSNVDSFCPPLTLSSQQEFDLVEASEPDQVEEQLRLSVPNELRLLPAAERSKVIAAHIAAGRELRITSTRELALYCALALIYGADFSFSPEWASKLEQVRDGKSDLISMVSALNEV